MIFLIADHSSLKLESNTTQTLHNRSATFHTSRDQRPDLQLPVLRQLALQRLAHPQDVQQRHQLKGDSRIKSVNTKGEIDSGWPGRDAQEEGEQGEKTFANRP